MEVGWSYNLIFYNTKFGDVLNSLPSTFQIHLKHRQKNHVCEVV
jgi:hypothetical protein